MTPEGQPMPQGQPLPARTWTRHHLPPDLAADLRQARQDQGLSLRRAAEQIGIDIGFLSRLETGKRAPRTATVWRIIDGLGIDGELAEALLDEAVDSPPA